MSHFIPPFKVGDIVTNAMITTTFIVGNMGGMRRSKATGTLVIISDHTKGLYDDKWYGDELHYTGMGKIGDQVMQGNQNRTLAESDHNGIEVHLFEVMQPAQYLYQGVVKLCGAPYQENQKDESGNLRKVWMFPLCTEKHFASVSSDAFRDYVKIQAQKAKQLSGRELETAAREHSSEKAAYRTVATKTFIRDPYIAQYAKERANGICQLCGKEAPFIGKDGKPYLESHHIIWLSQGGADSIENTVALCPNCHTKMHIVNAEHDRQILLRRAKV